MYDKVKHLGMTLKQWREEIFHNEFTLGELYQFIFHGVNLDSLRKGANK